MDLLPCYLVYACYSTLSGSMLRSAINRTREWSIFIKCDQCNPQHTHLRTPSLWHLTLAAPDSDSDISQRLQS